MKDRQQTANSVQMKPTTSQVFWAFCWIGLTSFGGGLVAYIQREIVERRGWLNAKDFLTALEITAILPGSNSINMAVMVGRWLHGPRGAIAALTGLLLPGSIALALIGWLYVNWHQNPHVRAALIGTAAGAVGLLLQMTLKIGGRQLLSRQALVFIIPSFVFVGLLHVSLPVALAVLGPLSIWMYRPRAWNTNASAPSRESVDDISSSNRPERDELA